MTTKTKTKETIFHSVRIERRDFKDKLIQLVYLPPGTQTLLNEQLKTDKQFEWEFRISEFRAILQGRYKEVVWADFSAPALEGKKPWLYLSEGARIATGKLIHSRLINWISRILASRKREIDIPESIKKQEIRVELTSIADCFTSPVIKKLVSSWFLNQFCVRNKQLTWSIPNTRGEQKDIDFPKEWFYIFNGSENEAVSDPVYMTSLKGENGKQYASYVISLHFEENDGQLIMHMKSSLRRWIYKPLLKEGKVFFPRNHSRSLYLIRSSRTGKQMTRFVMNEFQQKIYLSYYNQTVEMFEEMGFTPNLPVILSSPDQFYHSSPVAALIPYKTDDKSYPNLIEAGISKVEKTRIFDMFIAAFPFLQSAHPQARKLVTPPTTLKGGSIVLDHPEELRQEQIIIETYAKESALFPIIEEGLKSLIDSDKVEPRYSLEKQEGGKYLLKDNTSGSQIAITLKDCSEYVYLMQDLPYSAGGELSSERKRIKEIKSDLQVADENTFCLIEIGKYGIYQNSDPKKAIEKGFLETNRLTQCFHPMDDLKETEKLHKMKSCIADILARKGFTNQMISIYKEPLSNYTYYFPRCMAISVEKKRGYIFVMARMRDGITEVKYKGTDWMSLYESLMYLKAENTSSLYQSDNLDFHRFIEDEISTDQDVVVFKKDELPAKYRDGDEEFPYTAAIFDHAAHRNPYIDYRIDGIPSTGTFIVESLGEYYAVPPKLKGNTGKNYNTKQNTNKPFKSRHPLRITLSKPNDEIAVNLHLMRNLSLTFAYFINNPLPYHLLRYHEKLI
jgi:MID domain of pPIWI_RE/pPIWI_RE module N-terminal domain